MLKHARAYFDAHKQHGRDVWVADRFRSVDIAQVRRNLEHAGLLDGRVHLLEGDPAATLPEAPVDRVAVLHVGAGTGPDVAAVLEAVYPRLAPGGVVVVERASDRAVRASIDAFRAAHGITEAETTVASTATTWRRR